MSDPTVSVLHDVPILVTGASGFIGGCLAEHMAAQFGARVVGSGRRFAGQARLQQAGVVTALADLRDRDAMTRLCEGKQIVFHVAAWLPRGRGGEHEAYAINVEASEVLAHATAAAGVSRLILVSSVAAYGRPPVDIIDETVAVDSTQRDLYGRTKALGEIAVREVARRTGLSLGIVRPSMVYGPGSTNWTRGMLRLVQRGVPVLYGDGRGHAYPIYIDDLIDALVRVATRPQAHGEAFNVSDVSVPWATFFGHYGRMCGKAPRRMPLTLAHGLARANQWFRLGLPLTVDRLDTYLRNFHYPTTKAAQLLDWQVRVPLDEGMRRSEAWLRENGDL